MVPVGEGVRRRRHPGAAGFQSAAAGDTREAEEGAQAEPLSTLSRPALLQFTGGGSPPAVSEDAYSLRLVSNRKLYDLGTLVQHTDDDAYMELGSTVAGVNQRMHELLAQPGGVRTALRYTIGRHAFRTASGRTARRAQYCVRGRHYCGGDLYAGA